MRFLFLFLLVFVVTGLRAQIISTIAGNGTYGYSGDGGPATSAQFGWPYGVVVDNAGNVYISDGDNNAIRKVNSAGIVTNFAGNGTIGYSGDGGPAASATIYHPGVMAIDNAGNIYFADQNGGVIRKIDNAGIITSITGNLPTGYSGDGGPLLSARFNSISAIGFDNSGNMYITDWGNFVVRKVNSAGIITGFAGNGTRGYSGDGGPATAAQLDAPYNVLVRPNGDIFIPDARNNRIRVVNPAGVISTYAGTGVPGYSGDGGPAASAELFWPWHSTIDAAGNIYVVDAENYVIRKIDNSGIITTYAGNGTWGYSGDGGLAIDAEMVDPCGIACDAAGNIYVVNRTPYYVVRKITTCITPVVTQQPDNTSLCNTSNANFSIIASNTTGYQWEVNTGSGWTSLVDNSTYSGTATATLTVTAATSTMNNYQYRCEVSNNCSHIYSEKGLLTVTAVVTPSISIVSTGNTICGAGSVTFTASITGGGNAPAYQWQKNGISIGTNSFSYSDNGLQNGDVIRCVITSNANCVTVATATSNSITMDVTPTVTPAVNIYASKNGICSGTAVIFTATVTNGGTNPTFTWFKNNVNLFLNSPTYTDNTLENGDIIMCAVRSSLGCITSSVVPSLPIIMNVQPRVDPSVSITASATSICKNSPVVFTAVTLNAGSTPVYQWTKNSLPVGSNSVAYTDAHLSDGDQIACSVSASGGCLATPQVTSNTIPISLFPDPVVALDQDNSICKDGSRVLDAGKFSSYLWNTGSTSQTITITRTGLYSVTVTDNRGCKALDSVHITTVLPSPSLFLPADTSVCSYGSVLLQPLTAYTYYSWNTGSKSPSITVKEPGDYWLQVTDEKNCRGADTIRVLPKECMKGFFMPTGFTPNNDGKNDLLRPLLFGTIIKYQFWIYNRWGQTVFYSTEPGQGWDGKFKGIAQDTNVFVWMCRYELQSEAAKTEKGTAVLIR